MTSDPYRDATAGGPAAGSDEPPAPDPLRPPAESAWSRPTDDAWSRPADGTGSRPPDPGEPAAPWPSEAARPASGEQPPTPWPPAAAAHSTVDPPTPSHPTSAYQPTPYQTQPPPYQAQPAAGPPAPGQRTNALAVVALICSLAGVVTAISAPIGAILGHIALNQIRQTGEEGTQLAKAAIWVGWIITGLIVALCCAVFVLAVVFSRSGAEFAPR